ncbi:MAG: hypothetical protein JWM23_1224, partial [Microbacteriaceae bacterium]|nr:hypothetical protein [Microbacteriaceae bacterium]
MVGSILPGWSIDAAEYRPRRMSRERIWPVSRTEPCGDDGAAPGRRAWFGGRSRGSAVCTNPPGAQQSTPLVHGLGQGVQAEAVTAGSRQSGQQQRYAAVGEVPDAGGPGTDAGEPDSAGVTVGGEDGRVAVQVPGGAGDGW